MKHKYCGKLDEHGLRVGNGCQQWVQNDSFQKYSGQFLFNNLHKRGIYLTDKKGNQTYMDGLFYANKLEGYGKVVYGDNTIFEGLFKQHTRFGPGVLSYPDGTQDVGIWNGFSLRRLASIVGQQYVPRLGRTALGKARLLKYRKLIPIGRTARNWPKEVLTELGCEAAIFNSDELYNLDVKNPESLFFNQQSYDNFTDEECTIDVIISQEEFDEKLNTSKFSKESCDSENIHRKENDEPECTCFRPHFDKFDYLCAQLQEVEIKLEKLTCKRQSIEEKLNSCKRCYDSVWLQAENAKKQKNGRTMKTDSRKEPSVDDLSSTQETNENNNELTEIELKNYLYANTYLMDEHLGESDHQLLTDKISKSTLPFDNTESTLATIVSKKDFSEIINYVELSGENENSISTIDQYCCCKGLTFENVIALENMLKEFTQEELFYRTVKNSIKNSMDLEFQKLEQMSKDEARFIKKVKVTDLFAWNNENIWIEILQHSFRHRYSESNVSFKVSDLLAGYRHYFKNEGVYETNCRQFLLDCSEGRDKNILIYFNTFFINPDLCDVRGNTGTMLATVSDKVNVITALVNCGANLDAINDEGLTPLVISILKYISQKFKVTDWEQAFLRETEPINVDLKQWRPTESLLSVYNTVQDAHLSVDKKEQLKMDKVSSSSRNKKDVYSQTKFQEKTSFTEKSPSHEIDSLPKPNTSNKGQEQNYIFNTDFVRISQQKKMVSKTALKNSKEKVIRKKKQTSKGKVYDSKSKVTKSKHQIKKKKGKASRESMRNSKTEVMKNKNGSKQEVDKLIDINNEICRKVLETSKNTTLTLLYHGADPNGGDVPMKPIFLTVFADDCDLLYGLLDNKADPNTLSEENSTCLHLIASLNPSLERVKMCKILLKFNADPNIKTSIYHWSELKDEVIGEVDNKEQFNNECKNVLHLLSLREDFALDSENFLGQIANILITHGCITKDLYLGHTALSLAVLRGNVRLIQSLLKTKQVDPHQVLGNEMGNALTILILQRYKHAMDSNLGKDIVRTLIDNGLNPLNSIDNFENIVSFLENEKKLEIQRKTSSKKSMKEASKKSLVKKVLKKPGKISSRSSKPTSVKSLHKINKSYSSKRSLKKSTSSKKSLKKSRSKSEVESLEHYIIKETRTILYRHLEGKAVQYLYDLIEESLVADPLVVMLAKFVNPATVLNTIHLLFQNGIIERKRFKPTIICDLLKFVELQHVAKYVYSPQEQKIMEDKIRSLSWNKINDTLKLGVYLPKPEVDKNIEKYKICFQCLKGENKKLLKCPSCELVYFCSEECNNLNVKTCRYHKCKILYYNTVSEMVRNSVQPSRLSALLRMTEKLRTEKTVLHELQKLKEKITNSKKRNIYAEKKAVELVTDLQKLEKERMNFLTTNNLLEYGLILTQPLEKDEEMNILNEALVPSDLQLASRSLHDTISGFYKVYSNVFQPATSAIFHHYYLNHSDLSGDGTTDVKVKQDTTATISSSTNIAKRHQPSSSRDSLGANLQIFPNMSSKHKSSRSSGILKSPSRKLDDLKLATEDYVLSKIIQENYFGRKGEESLDKIKKLGDKNYYIELLSKIFADFNLPLLLLPYACYKDGQIYYSMSGSATLFGSGFHKLPISD